MRRFRNRFTWIPVVLILGGFVWFTTWVSDPLEDVERKELVTGTIAPAGALKGQGPFIPYVALHSGRPTAPDRAPDFPLDDRQPEEDGRFELSADTGFGNRFFLLVRFETAKQERYCRVVALPEMRRTAEGVWLVAETGKRLPPQRIGVDTSTPCA